jgi:hypothetical protein
VKHDLSIPDNFAFLFWKKIKRYRKGKLYNPKTKIKKRKKDKEHQLPDLFPYIRTTTEIGEIPLHGFNCLSFKKKKIGEKNFKTNKMVPT